ncbi:MAG: gamma-glutamylcyclotransferase [Burkholderiales bacterium]|nr:gamma-glutamylcyclotransferase [Burkholderiales bacterium]
MPILIFVYGTLKAGGPNFATNAAVRVPGVFVTVDALPLYLVGARHVPWLLDTPGQGHRVAGELYQATPEVLAGMDALERVGHPEGYQRVQIEVVERDACDVAPRRVQAYLKRAEQLTPDLPRVGPLSDYTPAHAALYRRRVA